MFGHLGLSVWLNDLWLLVTLVPAVGFIAGIVIPREERYLERNFPDQYSGYRPTSAVGFKGATVCEVAVVESTFVLTRDC